MAAVPLHEHEVVCGAWRELTTALRFGRVQVPCDATRDAANDGTGGAQQPGGWQQVLDVRWVAAQGRVLVALADGWLPGGGGGLFWAGSIVGRGGANLGQAAGRWQRTQADTHVFDAATRWLWVVPPSRSERGGSKAAGSVGSTNS